MRPAASIFALALGLAVPCAARAADSAAAESLFAEGKRLMAAGRAAEACRKFEDSVRLESGLGVRFQLAQCHEKVGHSATAWAGYLDVAADAHARSLSAKERVARERAAALEPKLSRLALDVFGAQVQGLVVKRNGVVVDRAQWGTPVPVDPGGFTVEASAPGRRTWQSFLEVTSEKTAWQVDIPELEQLTVAARVEKDRKAPQGREGAASSSTGTSTSTSASTSASPGIWGYARPTGMVLGIAGIAGIATGAYYGVHAISKNSDAASHCTGSTCDGPGVAFRAEAVQSGNVSTIAFAAGGSALAVGALLYLFGPTREASPREASPRGVAIAPGLGRLDVRGTW